MDTLKKIGITLLTWAKNVFLFIIFSPVLCIIAMLFVVDIVWPTIFPSEEQEDHDNEE